jgi:hypothetical protein
MAIPLMLSLINVFFAICSEYPFEPETVSFIRMFTALIGLSALIRVFVVRIFKPYIKSFVLLALGISGVAAVGSFTDFGRPQFYDAAADRPGFVHNVDMMVYFPLAKYAKELRFDGIYAAYIAAISDNNPHITFDALKDVYIRDLRDNRQKKIGSLKDEIRAVRKRFSDKRWKEFKADSDYFVKSLGLDFALKNMNDHGGNATPVWLLFAHMIFGNREASEKLLFAGAMADWILLAILFVVTVRVFGWPAAFIIMIVFGTDNFYMAGTNWAGSTLRHDWMVAIGLGVCALKKERWFSGGILLMIATLIRAFPGVVFVSLALNVILWFVFFVYKRRCLPSFKIIWQKQQHIILIAAGAMAALVVLVIISCVVYSPQIWLWWYNKVMLLNAESHVNNISLKVLFTYSQNSSLAYIANHGIVMDWQAVKKSLFFSRHFYYVAVQIIATIFIVLAGFGKHPYKIAVLGLMFIHIWMDPANYYQHIVFLMPLLAFEHVDRTYWSFSSKEFVIASVPLFMSVFSWFIMNRGYMDERYLDASVLVLTAYSVILAMMIFTRSEKTAFIQYGV